MSCICSLPICKPKGPARYMHERQLKEEIVCVYINFEVLEMSNIFIFLDQIMPDCES